MSENNIKKQNNIFKFFITILSFLILFLLLGIGTYTFYIGRQLVQVNDQVKKLSTLLNAEKDLNKKQAESSAEIQSKLNNINNNQTSPNNQQNIGNYNNLVKSIVKLYNISRSATVSGTGTIINDKGYILTNKHVIEEASSYFSSSNTLLAVCITLNAEEKPKCSYTAEIIAIGDGDLDLALLKIDGKLSNSNGKFVSNPVNSDELSKLPTFDIINNSNTKPELGSKINVLGYPGAGGDNISLTQGIYSGSLDEVYFKTDAKVNSGNSGGATFDNNNKFLGVPTAVSGGQGNIGLIIKAQNVINFIKESLIN
jgi:S1-C subfamily serine protease